MKQPGMTIEQVFKSVRAKLGKQTGGRQVPWELSSLQGDFYFVPGKLSAPAIPTPSAPETASDDRHGDSETSRAYLDSEQKKIDAEKNKLTRERELLEQKRALAEQKRRLAEMRKQLATVEKRPSASATNEIKRDGRFIDNGNGTVTDTKTGLMWAAKDNGSNINWENAKSYCENYRGGGYTDWRLPTQDELAWLYDGSKSYRAAQRDYAVYLTELIQLSTCCPWASETRGSDAAYFYFNVGSRYWGHQSEAKDIRALPVRSAK
jgi:hypothetical protein